MYPRKMEQPHRNDERLCYRRQFSHDRPDTEPISHPNIMNHPLSQQDRYRGCLLGLACGDAVGTTLEFSSRADLIPISDMVGGGPFDLPAGAWTDDCSMALCLAHSLIEKRRFDPADQMSRYCNWMQYGYLSSTGTCFDIGVTVSQALDRYLRDGNPFSGSTDPMSAGNGGIMRLAPVPMFYRASDQLLHFAGESSRTTHGAAEAIEAARLLAGQLRLALDGAAKDEILFGNGYVSSEPRVAALARGEWRQIAADDIRGTGYVIASLEAALWCFWSTDSFAAAVLKAANLGDDADTTAAVCGQIAGAYYGVSDIPEHWQSRLVMGQEIQDLADKLLDLSRDGPGK